MSKIYPFTSDNGTLLRDRLSLDLGILRRIKSTFSFKEKKEFINIYITEGVPFAFKKNPLIFEDSRNWIAKHLGTNPKNITLTGSSRLGFSLNPKKLGNPYRENSDLDLILVSEEMFKAYGTDFKSFVNDINTRIAKKQRIDAITLENIEYTYNSIKNRGFVDQFKIPIDRKYPTVYNTYDVFWYLIQRMKITPNCPKPYKATVRVYKDWESCLKQLTINFNSSLNAVN